MDTSPPSPGNATQETVFIIDDDTSLRRALARLFRFSGRNIEAFASAREFLDRLPYEGVGCVVLDVKMPGITGPELHELMSQQGVRLPVVFLSAHGDVPTSVKAMKKGAVDFLVKPVDGPLLLRTVDEAMSRHAAEHARHRAQQGIMDRFSSLSARQRQVMAHVIRGRLNKQIAADLNISIKTVKVHRSQVMDKMGVRSVAELVRACESSGIEALLQALPDDE